MKWFDNFLALPTIGLKYNHSPILSLKIPEILARAMPKEESWQLRIENPVKASISNGETLARLQNKHLAVEHRQSLVETRKPGLFPEVKIPEKLFYEHKLGIIKETISKVWSEFPAENDVSVRLIGIMMVCDLPYEQLPPGIAGYLDSFKGFWQKDVLEMDNNTTVKVDEHEKGFDRCHHSIEIFGNEEKVVNVSLDYQRIFEPGLNPGKENLLEIIEEVADIALDYFETFGFEGVWNE
ncbi:MAG: hypothetical protein ACQETH_15780 [Candidatus Rifleibacteriota bacterium]